MRVYLPGEAPSEIGGLLAFGVDPHHIPDLLLEVFELVQQTVEKLSPAIIAKTKCLLEKNEMRLKDSKTKCALFEEKILIY